MVITINGNTIDYTLEEEQTAGDVVNGLTQWLQQSGLLVGSLSLDDIPVGLTEDQWKSRDLKQLKHVAIEAVDLREGRVRQLDTATGYFHLLSEAIKKNDEVQLKELAEGYNDLMSMLPHLLGDGPEAPLTTEIQHRFQSWGFPNSFPSHPQDLLMECQNLISVLETRRHETEDPISSASTSARALASMAQELDQVAVQLQTGKDKEAMGIIIHLTELLQSLLRSLSWLGNSLPEELGAELTSHLMELEDALRAQDTVLIGDLLEYELKPRMEELPEHIRLLREGTT